MKRRLLQTGALLCALTIQADPSLHPLFDRAADRLSTRERGADLKISQAVESPDRPAVMQLTPKTGSWDCDSKLWMLVDVENNGDEAVLVRSEVTSKKKKGSGGNKGGVYVPPGETRTLPVLLLRHLSDDASDALKQAFGEMRGYPGGHQQTGWRQIDVSAISQVKLEFYTDAPQVECEVSKLRAAVDFKLPSEEELATRYLSMIDRFGQNANAQWPGKVESNDDLAACLGQETKWLEEQAPLKDRSRYGGWTGGFRVPASGHFKTLEKDGRWWLIDPEGYPFWSVGATGFSFGYGKTRTDALDELLGKEKRDLPEVSGNQWNPQQANLFRKFGDDWKEDSVEFTHRRLRVWGINTLGNWSSSDFYSLGKTPYTVAVHYRRPTIREPDPKAHSALPDVFHPDFEKSVHATMARFSDEAADPWCIGFFIDNELPFKNPTTPAQKTLLSDSECASRGELIARLKDKYGSVGKLNRAWATDFSKWDAIGLPRGRVSEECNEDLREFSEAWYHRYFKTCRDAMRAGAPDKLYLGSRINCWDNETAVAICAEYADVVSINLYEYTPDKFIPPQGFNAPLMIGEFHFGTITERGVWGAGLCTGMDVEHASDLFQNYLTEALKNPLFVGAHWFKYTDQPLAGRKDGENYRIGFVDITDTPYQEMVDACREVAATMYLLRAGNADR